MYQNKTNYTRYRGFSGTLFCFKQFNFGSYGNTSLNISVGLLKSDSSSVCWTNFEKAVEFGVLFVSKWHLQASRFLSLLIYFKQMSLYSLTLSDSLQL